MSQRSDDNESVFSEVSIRSQKSTSDVVIASSSKHSIGTQTMDCVEPVLKRKPVNVIVYKQGL